MPRWLSRTTLVVALALVAGATAGHPSPAGAAGFPAIRSWVLVGAYQDSSTIEGQAARCIGDFAPRPDSLRRQARTLSLRFLRDRVAEARPDFGGYRIYRMVGSTRPDGGADTTVAMLIRRFSVNPGSEMTWAFSRLDTALASPTYMQYTCNGKVVHDSILTFVDPDSNGNYVKVCRRRDANGTCLSKGDSIFVLQAPPGPHDGFRTWYSITYEELNTTDTNYQDLFLPDTLDNWVRCATYGDRTTCPNLNSKLANAIGPFEPTGGPTVNLEGVRVVPNPYRASEVWDPVNGNEIHFIELPKQAKITIFTVAGDKVQELHHDDATRDFERWDLKSANGREVASGIYIYRVEAGNFSYQNRFVIIR